MYESTGQRLFDRPYLDWYNICEIALLGGLGGQRVRPASKVVLLLPGHAEGSGQPVRRVAHRLVGRELGDGRQLGVEVVGPQLGEDAEAGSRGLGFADL